MSTRKQKAFASVRISVIFDWNKDFIIVGGATVNNIRNMSKMHTLTLEANQTHPQISTKLVWCVIFCVENDLRMYKCLSLAEFALFRYFIRGFVFVCSVPISSCLNILYVWSVLCEHLHWAVRAETK